MVQQILSGLTLAALVQATVQTLIMSLIFRLLLLAWGKKPPKEWAFWGASFVAFFLLVTICSAVLGTDKLPKLRGQVLAVLAGEMQYTPMVAPKSAPQDAGFVNLVVAVSNTGAPSIATEYQLTVTFASGETKTGQAIAIPTKGMKFPHKGDGGPAEIFYPEDQLARKTIQPIPKGGCVQGLLMFVISGASMQDLRAIGTSYRLEFKDLWGAPYVTEIKNAGMQDVMLDWPGIRSSTVEDEPEPIIKLPSPTPNKKASRP